ncbi:MAG: glycoside hydrolase, partial [Clostridia bacterium]|nr:glycoside hydrolase [Clostridia bacterium]
PVRWEGMPLMAADTYMRKANGGLSVAVDENGTVWTTAYGAHILPDGTLASKYCCCHVLRSDDNGHSWDYVNTIDYKEEYNNPNCIDIEGFNETSIMVAANGDLFFVIRSGSLHPFIKGDKDHPAPKFYCARSKDKGKTWDVKPFYDFGVFPVSVRLKCGTTLLTSGRPGVYIRQCDDENLENWADPVFLLTVPEEDIYGAYYEYSCSKTLMPL